MSTLVQYVVTLSYYFYYYTLLGDVLKTVLSLYMKDPNLPLPSSAEVCICTSTTTAEEVTL